MFLSMSHARRSVFRPLAKLPVLAVLTLCSAHAQTPGDLLHSMVGQKLILRHAGELSLRPKPLERFASSGILLLLLQPDSARKSALSGKN